MTEYDYSPEAYERYVATQQRIAKWVDKTERHRPEFEHAVPTSSNQNRNSGDSSGWRKLFKRSDSPSSSRKQRPADIYIPSPESISDDEYYDSRRSGSSHGPSPPPSAGLLLPHQQPIYHAMAQPMLSPPPMMVPPPYIQPVAHHSSSSSHRKHHSSRSHSRSRSHHSAGYYTMASPPLSPGYQYAYPSPPPLGGAPAGPYIMMPPQPNGHPGAHIMYLPLR